MKQTAVEWLIDESMKLVLQYMQGTLNENTLDDVIHEITTKAKEMEKEQIIDAVKSTDYIIGATDKESEEFAQQYYNETFKSE